MKTFIDTFTNETYQMHELATIDGIEYVADIINGFVQVCNVRSGEPIQVIDQAIKKEMSRDTIFNCVDFEIAGTQDHKTELTKAIYQFTQDNLQ